MGNSKSKAKHAPQEEKAAAKRERSEDRESRVRCPFCGSYDTELYSLFGSQLSTSQYYCRRCRVAFEALKWES